jgi:hypothetical protein
MAFLLKVFSAHFHRDVDLSVRGFVPFFYEAVRDDDDPAFVIKPEQPGSARGLEFEYSILKRLAVAIVARGPLGRHSFHQDAQTPPVGILQAFVAFEELEDPASLAVFSEGGYVEARA